MIGVSQHDDRDRISKLPIEILISIISRLTLREAIATRILSTRWRYLCTNEYATHLNFPPFNLSNCEGMLMRRRFGNYVNMINHIVDSHKAPKLKEFSVRMLSIDEFSVHMPSMEGASLEKWLGFALSKQVEMERATLEKWLVFALSKQVEIIDIRSLNNAWCVDYSFQLRNLIMQLPLGLICLKKLSLYAINVEDSEIELLLSNSPQLESLSIAMPSRLTKVSVVGQPTFMLKHLQICDAVKLKLVEICNMANLISLKLHYMAPAFVLTLNNVPKLVEFSPSADYRWTINNVFSGVAPSICSQLHILKIFSSPCDRMHLFMVELPEFKSLKHLELQHEPLSVLNHCFWQFLRVIQACPSLEELRIKLLWPVNTNFLGEERDAIAPYPKEELFPSLKKMKFSGFLGNSAELMFVLSILNNANCLEELTVEVCDATEEIRLFATASASQRIQPAVQHSTRLQLI